MAISKVDICNSALAKVGAARISSLEDNNKQGRLCKELYPRLADALIRSHPWNFAIERVEIAKDATAPAFGFSARFRKPTDCLRVLNLNSEYADEGGKYVDWKVEGDYILTNSATLKIKYVKDVSETPEVFDRTFAEALSYYIASDLAYPMAQSNTLGVKLFEKFSLMLANARAYDAQEGSSDRVSADMWLDSRYTE